MCWISLWDKNYQQNLGVTILYADGNPNLLLSLTVVLVGLFLVLESSIDITKVVGVSWIGVDLIKALKVVTGFLEVCIYNL